MTKDDGTLRGFDTGATRDTAEGKLDYEGFLSPRVMLQFAKYMNMNRLQSDGKLRSSDNWQKGIPMDVYMKSGHRHFFEWWYEHRLEKPDKRHQIASLCGLLFNTMGYLHEMLKGMPVVDFDGDEPTPEMAERQEKIENTKGLNNFLSYTQAWADRLEAAHSHWSHWSNVDEDATYCEECGWQECECDK